MLYICILNGKYMTYTCLIRDDFVFAYKANKFVAKFDFEIFCTQVISPREFKSFESNPEKVNFEIRKIELNVYKL